FGVRDHIRSAERRLHRAGREEVHRRYGRRAAAAVGRCVVEVALAGTTGEMSTEVRATPRWFWVVAGLLGVALVGLAVITTSLMLSVAHKNGRAHERDRALAVARQQAINL